MSAHSESKLNCPHLLIVFDLVVQNDPIGSLWLHPRQWDAVPWCSVLPDDSHCRWSCREKHYGLAVSTLYHNHTKPKVTGSSADIFIQQFASCELVPVDLIEFALHWGVGFKVGKVGGLKDKLSNRAMAGPCKQWPLLCQVNTLKFKAWLIISVFFFFF